MPEIDESLNLRAASRSKERLSATGGRFLGKVSLGVGQTASEAMGHHGRLHPQTCVDMSTHGLPPRSVTCPGPTSPAASLNAHLRLIIHVLILMPPVLTPRPLFWGALFQPPPEWLPSLPGHISSASVVGRPSSVRPVGPGASGQARSAGHGPSCDSCSQRGSRGFLKGPPCSASMLLWLSGKHP